MDKIKTGKTNKKRVITLLEPDLIEFLKEYADHKYTTVSAILRQMVVEFKERENSDLEIVQIPPVSKQ